MVIAQPGSMRISVFEKFAWLKHEGCVADLAGGIAAPVAGAVFEGPGQGAAFVAAMEKEHQGTNSLAAECM
jgi:hypothetical protein